jgi:hypothetical protein
VTEGVEVVERRGDGKVTQLSGQKADPSTKQIKDNAKVDWNTVKDIKKNIIKTYSDV